MSDIVWDDEIAWDDEKPKRTLPQELLRQAGLGGRMLAEGAADLAGIVANPVAVTANRIAGTQLPTDYTQYIGQALTNMGVPMPESAAERIANFGGRAMSTGGIGAAAVKPLATAATMGPRGAFEMFLGQTPATQIVAPTVGATTQQALTEAGADPMLSAAAGLATGVASTPMIAARELSGKPLITNPWAPTRLTPRDARVLGVNLPTEAPAPPPVARTLDPSFTAGGYVPKERKLPVTPVSWTGKKIVDPNAYPRDVPQPTVMAPQGYDALDAQMRQQVGLPPPEAPLPPVKAYDIPSPLATKAPVAPAVSDEPMPVTPVKWGGEPRKPKSVMKTVDPQVDALQNQLRLEAGLTEDYTGQSKVSFLGTGTIGQVWGKLWDAFDNKIGNPAWKWLDDRWTGQEKTLPGDTIEGKMARMWIDNYGLDKKFVEMKRKQPYTANAYALKILPHVREMMDMSHDDARLFGRMIQGDEPTPQQFAELDARTRNVLRDTGQKLVDLGVLPEDVFKANADTYIHREYMTHLKKKEPKTYFGRKIRLFANELKPRGGKYTTVDVEQVPELQAQGWELFGKEKNGKQEMRLQLTREQRDQLGQVDDAVYAVSRTMLAMGNDVATFQFYDDVAKTFGIDVPKGQAAPAGYVQMPADKIPKTALFKYGNLKDKWVPEEIATDIAMTGAMNQFRNTPGIKQALQGQSLWKMVMTGLNPPAHANNIGSNFIAYYMSDAKWEHLREAAKDYANYRRGAHSSLMDIAERYGVLNAQQARAELSNIASDRLKELMNVGDTPDLPGLVKKMGSMALKPAKGLVNLYQEEDAIFRIALLRDRMAKGMSIEEAAADARKFFIDYEINAPGVQVLRDWVVPFIAYPYRVVPLLVETAIRRPQKFAVIGGVAAVLHELGSRGNREKVAEERATMPEFRNNNMFGMPFMPKTNFRLGELDDGRDLFVDIYRKIPGGDVAELGGAFPSQLPGVPMPLQPSFGLYGAIYNAAMGVDPSKGQGIEGAKDEPWGARAKYLQSALTPNLPFIPGSRSYNKIRDSMAGYASPLGDVQPTWMSVANSLGAGLNIVDPKKNVDRLNWDAKKYVDAIRKDIRDAQEDYKRGSITKEQLDARVKEKERRAREYVAKAQKKINEGKINRPEQ